MPPTPLTLFLVALLLPLRVLRVDIAMLLLSASIISSPTISSLLLCNSKTRLLYVSQPDTDRSSWLTTFPVQADTPGMRKTRCVVRPPRVEFVAVPCGPAANGIYTSTWSELAKILSNTFFLTRKSLRKLLLVSQTTISQIVSQLLPMQTSLDKTMNGINLTEQTSSPQSKILTPVAIDAHGRINHMVCLNLYGTPPPAIPPRKQLKPNRPNAKSYVQSCNLPSSPHWHFHRSRSTMETTSSRTSTKSK